jgi:fatty-acyl-CoA synthase
MTETSPVCTISYPRAELRDVSQDERYRRAAMAGVPVPLVDLRVQGDNGPQPWDGQSVGEIQVRGVRSSPAVTTKHPWRMPKKVHPRRLASHRRRGLGGRPGFVRISDRTKDLIKSGGEWISSVDLGKRPHGPPAVAEAAVIAIPDDKWSERPLACVVCKPGQSVSSDESQRPAASPQLCQMATARPL